MNNITHFIFAIFQYNSMIRDTLEYASYHAKEYKFELYEYRKKNLTYMLENNTPVKHFFDSNAEAGEKIVKHLHEFIEDVYSDKSTIVRVSGNELVVDAQQHLAIYDYVVGLHETFTDIINGYINSAKNDVDELFVNFISEDDRLYRIIAYSCLVEDLEKKFVEFNVAMKQSNGQQTVQSNYILNELRQVNGLFNFVKAHNKSDNADLKEVEEKVVKLLAYMEGKEKLPEGKSFQDAFGEVKQFINLIIAKFESAWKVTYVKVIDEVRAFELARSSNKQ